MILTEQHERKVFSQFGEDGILSAILDVVGDGNKTFIEVAVDDGLECNCRNLRENRGFTGTMIDKTHENEHIVRRFITAENVQHVLRDVNAPVHPDVFSLDIDGVDWYVLRNLGPYLPRVLVCEFNAHFPKDVCRAVPYDPNFSFSGTRFHGASSLAFHRLANMLGLCLVYSNALNMFFVEQPMANRFGNADSREIRLGYTWSHPDDPRMDQMVDPFTVKCPEPE